MQEGGIGSGPQASHNMVAGSSVHHIPAAQFGDHEALLFGGAGSNPQPRSEACDPSGAPITTDAVATGGAPGGLQSQSKAATAAKGTRTGRARQHAHRVGSRPDSKRKDGNKKKHVANGPALSPQRSQSFTHASEHNMMHEQHGTPSQAPAGAHPAFAEGVAAAGLIPAARPGTGRGSGTGGKRLSGAGAGEMAKPMG